MISANQLYKSFGNIDAVSDLSFNVGEGETFGLLGPNGAGKTTSINMLVGLLQPDRGEINIDGGLNPAASETRKLIGIAPQSLSLYEVLTARENLTFFGQMYDMDSERLKSRVDWALEFAGLQDRSNDRLGTFSGGMKRRINMAIALIHEPKVVFLDEPTVGVDPQSRNHIFDNIERLQSDGLTIIYTTHYMEEAQRLCDRIAIVDHGKLLALDSIEQLVNQHGGHSSVTAEFAEEPGDDLNIPGQRDGMSIQFASEKPLEEIARLNSTGVRFQSLKVERPNLENVFLNLTGRSLRDE